jgi:uncharacterized protein (UPF0335 family)
MTEQYGDNIDTGSLLGIIESLEGLQRERKALSEEGKGIKAKAKESGFDIRVINCILKERGKDPDDVDEFNRELDRYKRALDTVADL